MIKAKKKREFNKKQKKATAKSVVKFLRRSAKVSNKKKTANQKKPKIQKETEGDEEFVMLQTSGKYSSSVRKQIFISYLNICLNTV